MASKSKIRISATKYILEELNIEKGSSNATKIINKITLEQLDKIVNKMNNLTGLSIDAKRKEILGSCRSMGIVLKND